MAGRELDEVIGRVASTPLDRSRPLWEFHFAEGLAGGRFALIGKVHHALADGVASVNLLARAMDLEGPVTDERDNDEAGLTVTNGDLLRAAARDHARQIAELPRLIKDAAVGIDAGYAAGPRSAASTRIWPTRSTHHRPSSTTWCHPQRRFASATLPLADVKATAKALGITVNDVVLAIATGGLRTLLLDYDGAADRAQSSRRCRPPPTSRTASPATRSAG